LEEIVMSTLREQMAEDLQLRGLTPKTQGVYLREVSNYAKYFGKSPDQLGEEELRQYLLHLLKERKLATGTYRFYFQGLKFLYTHTLKRQDIVEKIRCPRGNKKLPVVLDLSEVKALLCVTENLKHRAILTITYSAGLRVSEVARLRVSDIDSKRMMVRVQQGKGRKDRYSILSKTALECLREYWRAYRPTEWLFEGQKPDTPIGYTSIRNIFLEAKERAGIRKPVSSHTLRHSFATHLIEAGTSLHHVQLLLGHRSPTTTTVYLHVSRMNLAQVTSPLDTIPEEL
jgi:site-specific recombinase XerD